MEIEFLFPEARHEWILLKPVEFVKSEHCSASWNALRLCCELVGWNRVRQQSENPSLQFREALQPFHSSNRTIPHPSSA